MNYRACFLACPGTAGHLINNPDRSRQRKAEKKIFTVAPK